MAFQRVFGENVKIKVRSSYINGILHGRWDSYDKNGNLYSSSICKKGTCKKPLTNHEIFYLY